MGQKESIQMTTPPLHFQSLESIRAVESDRSYRRQRNIALVLVAVNVALLPLTRWAVEWI